ncbi:response regulator [Christensenella intestinihominis]|uniref:response regulator n=1 Tax=Christensenella intestinihominis TaxID=1851429 RepID=UPI000AB74860|nr:HD domain-containing phosphohydrolase [Christensenella intestinihominis]
MKEKVLIVDDAELNRAVLEELLSPEYDTVCACGGREAIEIMDRERDNLALVLLDVMMPDMNGYEVLESMNFNGTLKRTPVIMVTAADSAEDEEKCLRMGAMDFVRKPYVTDVVKRRVKNVVELYRYQNGLEEVLEQKAETLSNVNEIIVAVLTSVLETKTAESREHIQRVRLYTRELLKFVYEHSDDKNGLTPQTIETICIASVLHDIGELLIPEAILRKNSSELTDEEQLVWQQHTVKGCQLIEPLRNIENKDYIRYCYNICRYHHEKWDGSGFPDRLVGDDIPICAQAVALAHDYDRLVVSKGYSHEQAVERIHDGLFHSFSPVLVETFQLVADNFRTILARNPEQGK